MRRDLFNELDDRVDRTILLHDNINQRGFDWSN